MYDRYVNYHKLNNLLWVWNANAPRDLPFDQAYSYADFYPGPGEVKTLLARQVNSPVRWIEEMEKMMAEGVDRALEVGPGKVLRGLMRNISRDVEMKNIENLETLKDFTAAL